MNLTRSAYSKAHTMFHRQFLQVGLRKQWYQQEKETEEEI